MTRLLLFAAGLCVWLVGMLAILQVAQADLQLTHTICGPWGCGPQLEALIACHGFWLVLLLPPAAVAAHYSSITTINRVSVAAIMVGLAGLLFVVGWQAANYLPKFAEGETSYFLQRCLFVVAITIEFPMSELLLVGMVGWIYAGRRTRCFRRAQQPVASAG